MLRRRSDPIIAWDHEAGCFRVSYPAVKMPLDPLSAARESVSNLLMKEFGRRLPSTRATVPQHLRRYVKTT